VVDKTATTYFHLSKPKLKTFFLFFFPTSTKNANIIEKHFRQVTHLKEFVPTRGILLDTKSCCWEFNMMGH
jgi:hypothetical protein